MSNSKPKEKRRYNEEFVLTPRERAFYGATITARSLDNGQTRTFARTNETALDAVRLIIDELDALPGNFRVVCISTPVTIARDAYASRLILHGEAAGQLTRLLPEVYYLSKIKRIDMLHPVVLKVTAAVWDGPTAA